MERESVSVENKGVIMFHKHNWVIIKETHSEPDRRPVQGCSTYLAERMCFGLTTILLQCSICRKIRKEEMLGK